MMSCLLGSPPIRQIPLCLHTAPTSSYRLLTRRVSFRAAVGLDSHRQRQQQQRCGCRRSEKRVGVKVLAGWGDWFKSDDGAERTRKAYQPKVDQVNKLEAGLQRLTDEQLRDKTVEFQRRVQQEGESLDSLLPEAFAVVREASSRVLGLRPFDVQLIGGMILHRGDIAEMRTGEGKTLVAVLPAYLNALGGKGVQIVTVNDYLARRDSEWVGQVHRFLGLQEEERRAAYAADVTYVTNSELGFDYLRDNLAQTPGALVLRNFNYCIIDEVDSILIDEARTPLIISGPSDDTCDKYEKAAKIADAFVKDVHYTIDEKQKNALLTEDGYEQAEDVLQVTDLYDPRFQWASYLINAVKAKELQLRDVNYIVREGEVIIVDEFTGRTMQGRRWGEGLHQAVEAKEGLKIQDETVTVASISYQNFFRSYPKLAGMTGTAATESEEFANIYNLRVTVVPPNRTVSRKDEPDVVFGTEDRKWGAVVTEIQRMVKAGRPVLVGTTSVERSEKLAQLLDAEDTKYQLLNAKPENVERESEIVAQSGRAGQVTIATNMAGRGTDILLGGNPEFMARLKLRGMLMPHVVSQEEDPSLTAGRRAAKKKTWHVSPTLFPRELPDDVRGMAQEAVRGAIAGWGENQLQELDAEDRLAVACERSPTNDAVMTKLRTAFQAIEALYKQDTDEGKAAVVAAGGLHVVGTERHESRRIDNQLRGRSGRQGDPGSTRYFLSLEDNLFRIFGGERIKGMMTNLGVGDLPIESRMLSNALNEAQRKVETYFFDIRKQLFEYDQVLNTQRDRVYSERRRALLAKDLSRQMIEYAERTMDDILEANVDPSLPPDQWPLESLAKKLIQYCYLLDDLTPELLQQEGGDYDKLRQYLRSRGREAYDTKVQQVNEVEPNLMADAQRFFVLTQTDNLWKEHLQAIKFLQQAVGLRGYAQRDPLTEYKLEGYNLFLDMMAQIRRNTIYNVYQFNPASVVKHRAQQPKQQELQEDQPEVHGPAQGGDGQGSGQTLEHTGAAAASKNGTASSSNGAGGGGRGSKKSRAKTAARRR